jgi:hypothetical protein
MTVIKFPHAGVAPAPTLAAANVWSQEYAATDLRFHNSPSDAARDALESLGQLARAEIIYVGYPSLKVCFAALARVITTMHPCVDGQRSLLHATLEAAMSEYCVSRSREEERIGNMLRVIASAADQLMQIKTIGYTSREPAVWRFDDMSLSQWIFACDVKSVKFERVMKPTDSGLIAARKHLTMRVMRMDLLDTLTNTVGVGFDWKCGR